MSPGDNSWDLDCQVLTEKLDVLWFPIQNLPEACVAQRGVAEERSCVLNVLHGSIDQKTGPIFHPER